MRYKDRITLRQKCSVEVRKHLVTLCVTTTALRVLTEDMVNELSLKTCRVVSSASDACCEINLSSLPAGQYFCPHGLDITNVDEAFHAYKMIANTRLRTRSGATPAPIL